MKNYPTLFILCIIISSFGSCKDKEENVPCLMIAVPMTVNINYVDETGKELLFGENPTYPIEDINIYRIQYEEKIPIHLTVNDELRFITLNLPQSKDGTFFIELEPNEIDKITVKAEIDEDAPCRSYFVTELEQNKTKVRYDEKKQVWEFVK